ncbi:MAG: glutathione S-transferase [Phyllobacteriaceae bacterium]|nr:glutathione S-transferase [Phyllobacteriaceae bacterium]
MYELFIANKNYSSWSLRPWAVMKALGIPFRETLVHFIDGANFDRFRKFAPNGKVPCLHHDGRIVWDSLAIAEYLAERHDGVWPKDEAARAWARSAAAEMHSGFSTLRNHRPMNIGVRIEPASTDAATAADIARIDELWCEGLERFGGPFLAGAAFTAVDAFFSPVAYRAQTYGIVLSDKAADYAAHLRAQPFLMEWEEAGLAETMREPGHDAEIAAIGKLVADLRG